VSLSAVLGEAGDALGEGELLGAGGAGGDVGLVKSLPAGEGELGRGPAGPYGAGSVAPDGRVALGVGLGVDGEAFPGLGGGPEDGAAAVSARDEWLHGVVVVGVLAALIRA